MGTLRRISCIAAQRSAAALILVLGAGNAVLADAPGGSSASAAPISLPQKNILSSIKESLRLDPERDVIRGYFDLGSAPNSHRYYCLLDTKSGRREPNGVLGSPVPLPGGRTGLKDDSVSLYGCDDAEKSGLLITAGYAPTASAGVAVAPPLPVPNSSAASPREVDVAGLQLGMSLDAARASIKSKKLSEYKESTETLSYWDAKKGAMRSLVNGRFVNVIEAWTAAAAGDAAAVGGEAYELMFTPVPGAQRVLAIIHSVRYAPADAVREIALEKGLVEKYGGYAQWSDLPDSPTWSFQRSGNMQVGDACRRRGMFGGLGGLNLANRSLENIALKTPSDELQFEVQHCGVAIVTEDHHTANGGALAADRLVTRFTVTAYSPSIALAGSKAAAQLIETAKGALHGGAVSRAGVGPVPNL